MRYDPRLRNRKLIAGYNWLPDFHDLLMIDDGQVGLECIKSDAPQGYTISSRRRSNRYTTNYWDRSRVCSPKPGQLPFCRLYIILSRKR